MSKPVLAELGITAEAAQGNFLESRSNRSLCRLASAEKKDYFVERDGVCYAGTHLLIEMWGARNLDNEPVIRETLAEATEAAGATLLKLYTHRFTPYGGVSGVVVLAESHISIHTWPERGYVALDVFMCGECVPYDAVKVLKRAFAPESLQISEHKRGLIP